MSYADVLFSSALFCLHEGTWEERDMTDFSKSRITELCKDLQASKEGADHSSEVCAAVTGKSVEREIALSSQDLAVSMLLSNNSIIQAPPCNRPCSSRRKERRRGSADCFGTRKEKVYIRCQCCVAL